MPGAFTTAQEAANDPRILAFGRLIGAANRWEYILGRDLEAATGLSHSLFELLLLVGRGGDRGILVGDISRGRVLTSGGATRLVQRALDRGLVSRTRSPADARAFLIRLTPLGTQTLVDASEVHARNIEIHLTRLLPQDDVDVFSRSIRTLSEAAARQLPQLP